DVDGEEDGGEEDHGVREEVDARCEKDSDGQKNDHEKSCPGQEVNPTGKAHSLTPHRRISRPRGGAGGNRRTGLGVVGFEMPYQVLSRLDDAVSVLGHLV